jgi:AmmeMemoRadiSam system protein A
LKYPTFLSIHPPDETITTLCYTSSDHIGLSITPDDGEMSLGLRSEERDILLNLANAAVVASVGESSLPTIDHKVLPPRLTEPGASFVTLKIEEQLRGCMGTIEAKLPLAEDVIKNASSAALRDPRFLTVTLEEIDLIETEVSVLTTPEILMYSSSEDLLSRLKPGVDGVIAKKGARRATFLPQVWKKVEDAEDFLSRLCLKANFTQDAWRSEELEIFTYTVESFSREPQGR